MEKERSREEGDSERGRWRERRDGEREGGVKERRRLG